MSGRPKRLLGDTVQAAVGTKRAHAHTSGHEQKVLNIQLANPVESTVRQPLN